LELLDGDWLEVDDDWLLLDDGDWLLVVEGDVLAEAPWSLDVLDDDGLPELPIELDDERSEPADGDALVDGDTLVEEFKALDPDWPHLSIAACVLGPRMPSTGPGSQPCDFSCCCCWRTDSSPLGLAFALAPLDEAEAPVDEFSSAELEGCDCALEDGDWELEDGDCDCAYAEPAARIAAMAMASFLEVIRIPFLSGGEGAERE